MTSTYEMVATSNVSNGTTGTVTFSTIPSTYTDLILIINGGCDGGGLRMRFNSDTGSNFSTTTMYGNGSSAASSRFSNQTYIDIAGVIGGNTANTNTIVQIQNYANTTTNKTALTRCNTASSEVMATVGLWRSTSAITTVAIQAVNGNGYFTNGSTLNLYGIKAE
jgi:hypothetical protein